MAQELEEFKKRSEETGEFVYFCPEGCKNGDETPLEFETKSKWKAHMQREHGGYTVSEPIGEVGSDGAEAAASVSPQKPIAAVPRPKKLSAKSRELNEKLNAAIKLCVKHLVKGIDETERSQLSDLTNDVAMSWVGIEIDFEEKLFNISGKWASIILVVALYVVPHLPSLKDMLAQMKKAEQPQTETAAATD